MTNSKKTVFESIISSYSTPSYVFDIGELAEWVSEIKGILPDNVSLCYAMKANPFLTAAMSDLTDRLEVCSPGEYEICIRNNIDPDMIVVSGVNKTFASMERIMSYSSGAGVYTIESPLHYDILKRICTETELVADNRRLRVLLRLSNGNQFGMDKDTLIALIKDIQTDNIIDISGIHYYGGTQKTSKKMLHELAALEELGNTITEEYKLNNLELEYGPGLPVEYFIEKNSDTDRTSQLALLSEHISDIGIFSHITIELGRYLAAYCGYFITRIMDKKSTNGTHYLIVDGGIHQLSYYGQMLGMKKPYIEYFRHNMESESNPDNTDTNRGSNTVGNDCDTNTYTICGSLCTANDVLVKQYELPTVNIGDILIFERCGAYSVTEAMALFLSRELPQVLILKADNTVTILREQKETNPLNS